MNVVGLQPQLDWQSSVKQYKTRQNQNNPDTLNSQLTMDEK
jgi:hypothetical protein